MTTRTIATLFALALAALSPAAAAAQSQFSPAITVNDSAISFYEIDQRAKLLRVFNTPGDLEALAREQLVEDRLKLAELDRAGLQLSEESLAAEMEAFAGRADLPYEQFIGVLAEAGVAEETLRDFVRVGVSWRDYIRTRYRGRAEVNEADVDQTLAAPPNGGTQIEVLLNEIIIPAPPPRAAEAQAIAERISQTTSTAAFEAAAREYSALPSRERGGRLDWLPIANYPPPIQALVLGLAPGEVTAPLPIPNGIALFQLRAVREVAGSRPQPVSVEYATLYLPGGRSAAAVAEARAIEARLDTCDDLYGIARGLPPEQLVRRDLPVGQVPTDIALELARLDDGETSTALTANGGQSLVLLMLCERRYSEEPVDREAVASNLRSQRLSGFADQLLAELRAAAVIRGQ
ncbi:PPIC-type PPIASE domain protein [Oceanicola granulosus HTCC2516]|uniref:Parvulin-like PPIase n=1 Tax=Oceanicola granulosus (strain ATCC BAA-861 / DSM 15982 / KCTC 12143 / HTCC2516) TaxID=314256 RepID=Q2CC13_OCEGH|nr:peptidylprolyl isomerase [Oceanicola granulosus]EAR50181.1 PPIC-type PPIASE domain protein [Oceanicola granulosus HTCC2516]